MEWISLKDRRPMYETYVLLGKFSKRGSPRYAVGCSRLYIDKSKQIPEAAPAWDTGRDEPEPIKNYTHWMPLPVRPE